MLEEVLAAVENAVEKQTKLDEYDKARREVADDSIMADGRVIRVVAEQIRKPEVLCEFPWLAYIALKQQGIDRTLHLISNGRKESNLHKIYYPARQYFWHEFADYSVFRKEDNGIDIGLASYCGKVVGLERVFPIYRLYMHAGTPWEKQLEFIRDNDIKLDLSLLRMNPKGIKRKIKELEEFEFVEAK